MSKKITPSSAVYFVVIPLAPQYSLIAPVTKGPTTPPSQYLFDKHTNDPRSYGNTGGGIRAINFDGGRTRVRLFFLKNDESPGGGRATVFDRGRVNVL